MAELKDLLKYIPEAVGYFQGRRAIKDEVARLREQDPVRQERIQMDPGLQQAFREGNTRGDVDQQLSIDRSVQEAIRRNPRNIAKAIEAGQAASSKTRAADNLRRIRNLQTAGTLGQRLNQLNATIDLGNEMRERQQEDRIANAEFQKRRLNMRGLSTLGDLIGDAASLNSLSDNPNQNLNQLETRTAQEIDQPEGVELPPIEERELIRSPQPVGTFEEILAAAKREDELNRLNQDPTSGLDPESLGLEQYTQPSRMSPIPGEGYVEGGAVVTPDGYDHDGVDINMTDAESGRFLGSVESAEMIVNADDTNEGLRLAKKNPDNPLSKWYLNLTKRFQKEAKEREAQNKR